MPLALFHKVKCVFSIDKAENEALKNNGQTASSGVVFTFYVIFTTLYQRITMYPPLGTEFKFRFGTTYKFKPIRNRLCRYKRKYNLFIN